MILAELVGDLPMVIAKAIMNYIKRAEDHNKEHLTIQGDVNVILPDLNILIGLNQMVTQGECAPEVSDVLCQTDFAEPEAVVLSIPEVPEVSVAPVVPVVNKEPDRTEQGKGDGDSAMSVAASHTPSKSVVDVGVQTIKVEEDDANYKSIGPKGTSHSNQIGTIQSVDPEIDSDDDSEGIDDLESDDYDEDDDELDELPFDASDSPGSATREEREESMEVEDNVINISPRTPRTRSRANVESGSESGGRGRPRRTIKHTPKLQDLLSRRKQVKSRRSVEAEKAKSATATPVKKGSTSKTKGKDSSAKSSVKGEPKTPKTSKKAAAENEELFTCDICNKTFKRKSSLSDHMFTHNKEAANYKCPMCDKLFLRLSKLKGHHESAHGAPIEEETLMFLQSAASGLKAIEALEKQEDGEVFSCDLCGRCFNRKSSLKDHMFIHYQHSSYQCPECKKYFLRLSKLRIHYEKAHDGVLDVDKLPLPPPRDLEPDVLPVSQAEKEKKGDHECPVCLLTFKRHSSMKEHLFVHDRQHGFKCDFCELTCVSEARLNRHMRRKHAEKEMIKDEERPFKCKDCPQAFATEEKLKEHSVGHEVPKEFKCGRCTEVFPTLLVLLRHQKTVHLNTPSTVKDREFQCGICLRQFANSSALKFHLKTHEDLLRCNACDKAFVREEELMAHYEKAHGLKRDRRNEWLSNIEVRCLVCAEDFESYYDLLQHQNATHSSLGVDFVSIEGCVIDELASANVDPADVTFACKICDNFQGTRVAADIHMDANHATDLNLSCEYCDLKFWQESSLRTHLILSHNAQRIYECKVCMRKFMKPTDISNHRKTDHRDVSQAELRGRVDCKHCGKSFNTPSRLEDHIWVVHDKKPKPLQCPHCPKRFMRNYYLKDHLQSHTGEMKYMCEVCGKGFRRPYELEQHRHDDELYKCQICETTFTTLNGYKTHVRRHTEAPPLICRYCGKTFFFKVHLANHERHHTGEKPFQCDVCDKFFRTKNSMNEHKKSHGDNKHSCSTCNRSFTLRRQLMAHIRREHSSRQPLFYCNECDKSFMKRQSFQNHLKKHELRRQTDGEEEEEGKEEEEDSSEASSIVYEEDETSQAVVYLVVDENNVVVSQSEDHIFVSS